MTEDERRAAAEALRYAAHQMYYGWGDPNARPDPPAGSAAALVGIRAVSVGDVLCRLADEIRAGKTDNIYGSLDSLLASAKWLEDHYAQNRTTGAAEAQQTPGGAEKSQEVTTTDDR